MSATTTRAAGTGASAPTRHDLSSGATVRLIAGREIRVRLTSKPFVWTTVALVAAVVLGSVLLDLVGSSGASTERVGLTPDAASLSAPLVATADAVGVSVETQEVADEAAGEALLTDGEISALVTATSPELAVTVQQNLSDSLAPVFGALAQQLSLASAVTDLGGDPATVAQDMASATPAVTSLEPQVERDGAPLVAGFVTGILLFLALMMAGNLVAQGVVEEKSSRVVELLLSTVKPWQLMAGKVLGIGAIGTLQVGLVVVAGAGSALALGLLETSSLDVGATAAWALIWFVLGFAAYALVLAALASLVSRQEDVGSVIAPVTTLMIVPYIVGISIAPWDPTNPLVVWMSYIPFCAPMLMPMRIALGSVEPWEIALSVGLSVAIIPLLVWLAGRVYSRAVLRSGGRMKLRDALAG